MSEKEAPQTPKKKELTQEDLQELYKELLKSPVKIPESDKDYYHNIIETLEASKSIYSPNADEKKKCWKFRLK